MKIPSLFRTPGYQRFNIEPRYYDPIKEQLNEREARIKQTLMADKADGLEASMERKSSIQGTFSRNRGSKGGSASYMQMFIMLLLTGLIFGYMYFGNMAIYIVVAISSVLLYLKVKRIL